MVIRRPGPEPANRLASRPQSTLQLEASDVGLGRHGVEAVNGVLEVDDTAMHSLRWTLLVRLEWTRRHPLNLDSRAHLEELVGRLAEGCRDAFLRRQRDEKASQYAVNVATTGVQIRDPVRV